MRSLASWKSLIIVSKHIPWGHKCIKFATISIFIYAALYLKLIRFNILPEGVDNGTPGGGVYSEQSGEPKVKFKLRRLVVEHKHHCAFHVAVTCGKKVFNR